MKSLALLLLLIGSALPAGSANVRVVEGIWVPDGWVAPETANTVAVRSYKPSVPASFRQRDVGVVLDIGSVTINRNEESKGDAKQYILRIGDEKLVVSPGGTLRLDGHRFRVLGEHADGLLILQDRRTKSLWRFRKEAPPPPETPPATPPE